MESVCTASVWAKAFLPCPSEESLNCMCELTEKNSIQHTPVWSLSVQLLSGQKPFFQDLLKGPSDAWVKPTVASSFQHYLCRVCLYSLCVGECLSSKSFLKDPSAAWVNLKGRPPSSTDLCRRLSVQPLCGRRPSFQDLLKGPSDAWVNLQGCPPSSTDLSRVCLYSLCVGEGLPSKPF
jgi:hypothetical protein